MSRRRSDAVIELGQRLVKQFDAKHDLLVSWMAHYVAELVEAVEKAKPEERTAAQETCARAILELWRHRASLPDGARPLPDVDAVLATLTSLADDRTDYRYYPSALRKAKAAGPEDKSKGWLEFALEIDFMARFLIRELLQMAAQRAASTAASWVGLLNDVGAEHLIEASVVEIAREAQEEGVLDDARRRKLVEIHRRIRSFIGLANAVEEDVRADLVAMGWNEADKEYEEPDDEVPSGALEDEDALSDEDVDAVAGGIDADDAQTPKAEE